MNSWSLWEGEWLKNACCGELLHLERVLGFVDPRELRFSITELSFLAPGVVASAVLIAGRRQGAWLGHRFKRKPTPNG